MLTSVSIVNVKLTKVFYNIAFIETKPENQIHLDLILDGSFFVEAYKKSYENTSFHTKQRARIEYIEMIDWIIDPKISFNLKYFDPEDYVVFQPKQFTYLPDVIPTLFEYTKQIRKKGREECI